MASLQGARAAGNQLSSTGSGEAPSAMGQSRWPCQSRLPLSLSRQALRLELPALSTSTSPESGAAAAAKPFIRARRSAEPSASG